MSFFLLKIFFISLKIVQL